MVNTSIDLRFNSSMFVNLLQLAVGLPRCSFVNSFGFPSSNYISVSLHENKHFIENEPHENFRTLSLWKRVKNSAFPVPGGIYPNLSVLGRRPSPQATKKPPSYALAHSTLCPRRGRGVGSFREAGYIT